jgi:hypothetical protein
MYIKCLLHFQSFISSVFKEDLIISFNTVLALSIEKLSTSGKLIYTNGSPQIPDKAAASSNEWNCVLAAWR